MHEKKKFPESNWRLTNQILPKIDQISAKKLAEIWEENEPKTQPPTR